MDIDTEWDTPYHCSLFTGREAEYDDDVMDVDIVDLWYTESPMIEDIEMIDVTS